MRKRDSTKLMKRAAELKIKVSRHQYGNKNEWCVEFPWKRTVYTVEQGREFFKRWQAGELTEEYMALAHRALAAIRESEDLLELPHREINVYW